MSIWLVIYALIALLTVSQVKEGMDYMGPHIRTGHKIGAVILVVLWPVWYAMIGWLRWKGYPRT